LQFNLSRTPLASFPIPNVSIALLVNSHGVQMRFVIFVGALNMLGQPIFRSSSIVLSRIIGTRSEKDERE
jgi:hypothetical protein